MSFLVPCEACRRHVLASEFQCPFCAAPVTAAMRVPRGTTLRSRVGRAAMLVVSSTTAVACGGDSDDSGSRKQATEPAEPGSTSNGNDPSPAEPMDTMGDRPAPDGPGNPVMTPEGEPMDVAEYGGAILPPTPAEPTMAPTMAMMDPPPDDSIQPVYGAPALPPTTPPVMVEPEPPPVEPEPPAEPEPQPSFDAGAPVTTDAGAEGDAGALPVTPVEEPEPMVLPAYGVAIMPVE
jgi:hypothetical protein